MEFLTFPGAEPIMKKALNSPEEKIMFRTIRLTLLIALILVALLFILSAGTRIIPFIPLVVTVIFGALVVLNDRSYTVAVKKDRS
jgi:uncharacterized membrane protein